MRVNIEKNFGEQEFTCESCEVKLTINHDKYTQVIGEQVIPLGLAWRKRLGFPHNANLKSATPSFILATICPYCKNEITKYIPIDGEKSRFET